MLVPAPATVAFGEQNGEDGVRVTQDKVVKRAPSHIPEQLKGFRNTPAGLSEALIDRFRKQ